MLEEDLCMDLRDVVDCLYADFTWYEPEEFTKRDIKKFKELVKELNGLSRKIK